MMRYMEREKPKRSAFHRWVVKCFLGHDDPAGDLAYDMARDDFFPEDDNYDAVYDYLVYQRETSQECIDVFKAVWKMYEERAYA